MKELDYWERLSELQLYSLERRRERYMVIYVWKIVRGLVPNMVDETYRVEFYYHVRRGRVCRVPPINNRALASIRTLREGSLSVRGPRSFNSLPKHLRNHDGTLLSFKNALDNFLQGVPDTPNMPHYPMAAASNSIGDQLTRLRLAD